MNPLDRLTSEQHFHDRQAFDRAATLANRPGGLRFTDTFYLDHETWIRPALAQLGTLRDKTILDYGCGHGMAAAVLARAGARVTAFDLSRGYLTEAAARAKANGVCVDFAQVDGERLPFADAAFDGVWGNAVLHHLDLAKAGRELWRVLRPGGVAVFCEPWGENPLLNLARRWLPYPGKQRTRDEQPLRRRQLRPLVELFAGVEIHGYQLLAMMRRVLRGGRLAVTLERCDTALLRRLPALAQFCRYVVLTLRS